MAGAFHCGGRSCNIRFAAGLSDWIRGRCFDGCCASHPKWSETPF
jgi:hypothetical protein